MNEKQRRLYAGLESFKIGHDGDKKMADFFGLDPHTIAKGRREILGGKSRQNQFGKKVVAENLWKKNSKNHRQNQKILKYETAGHPITGLKWTRKTTEKIAVQLKSIGIDVSSNTVCRLLKGMGFSLRVNSKNWHLAQLILLTLKKNQQFEYIGNLREHFASQGLPTISVDTKKKIGREF